MSDAQKFSEEFQRMGKDGFEAAVSSFGEVNKGFRPARLADRGSGLLADLRGSQSATS